MSEQAENKPKKPGPADHLPKIKPGQSGNPKGRPKGAKDGIRAHFNRLLRKIGPEEAIKALRDAGADFETGTGAELIAGRLFLGALSGDPKAMAEAIKLVEPQLPRAIELTGADGGPIQTESSSADIEKRLEQYGPVFEAVRSRMEMASKQNGKSKSNGSNGNGNGNGLN